MAKSTLELVCMCEPPFGRAGSESCARRARRGVTRFLCGVCGPWPQARCAGAIDTAHHGFDTMGPCVIAPESGKVKLKGFGLKSKRVESGARVGRSASRRRRPAAASRPSGRGELRDHDTLTIAAEKITFATRNRGNPSRRVGRSVQVRVLPASRCALAGRAVESTLFDRRCRARAPTVRRLT